MLLVCCLSASAEKRKVIINDDGFGLMHLALLGSDEVEVLGVTTVSGNTWANRVTAYNLRGLEVAGRTDVPVVPGALFPLVNTEQEIERWESLYGRLTWKGAWMKAWVEETEQALPVYYAPDDPVEISWGMPTTEPSDEIAANFLIRMVRKYPGKVTIIEGGPMTNLALAQRLDPEFASMAQELVYMGGSFNPRQTLDNPVADDFAREFANSPRREFNIRFDPEAASIVSRSPWRKITVVPVDPSTSTQLTEDLLKRIARVSPNSLAELLEAWPTGFPLWDEIAAAVWLDPSLVVKSERLFVDYSTDSGAGYGDTLSWRPHYEPGLGEQLADVVLEVDREALEALLVESAKGLNDSSDRGP